MPGPIHEKPPGTPESPKPNIIEEYEKQKKEEKGIGKDPVPKTTDKKSVPEDFYDEFHVPEPVINQPQKDGQ